MTYEPGDYLTHRFNPELGIGRVTALDGRAVVVEFPRPGTTLRLAANTDALIPVDLSPGQARARHRDARGDDDCGAASRRDAAARER